MEGNVTADPESNSALSVSEDGTVEGGVTVPYVVLHGIVRGDVCASQRVELGPTARVIGNVYYNLIEMAIGAEINGKLVHQPKGQVPLLEQTGGLSRDALFWHYTHYRHQDTQRAPSGAVRAGDYKLIEWFEDGSLELFDLAVDPGESIDLFTAQPAVAEELRTRLADWRDSIGAAMPRPNPDWSP